MKCFSTSDTNKTEIVKDVSVRKPRSSSDWWVCLWCEAYQTLEFYAATGWNISPRWRLQAKQKRCDLKDGWDNRILWKGWRNPAQFALSCILLFWGKDPLVSFKMSTLWTWLALFLATITTALATIDSIAPKDLCCSLPRRKSLRCSNGGRLSRNLSWYTQSGCSPYLA